MLYNIVVVFAICWHESAMGTPKFYSSFMPNVSSILHTHTQNKFILRLHIYPEEEQIKMNNSVAECGALESYKPQLDSWLFFFRLRDLRLSLYEPQYSLCRK